MSRNAGLLGIAAGISLLGILYAGQAAAQSGGYYFSYILNGTAQENGPYDNWNDCIDARNQFQQEAEGMEQSHEGVVGSAQNANAMGFSASAPSGDDIPSAIGICSVNGTSESDSSSAGGTDPYANDPRVMMAKMMGKMLGMMLVQGMKDLLNNNQQGASQQQAAAERQRELEAERIQAALARQAAFRASMRSMVENEMKGPTPPEGEMSFKGGSPLNGQEMTFKNDGTDFFRENGGSNQPLHFRTAGNPMAAPKAALSQLEAANCLSRLAAQPGISPADSKYLTDQAAQVMQGGAVTVNLNACKQHGGVPAVPAPAARPVRTLTHDQITLYTQLLDQVDNEQQQAVALNQHIRKLEQARKQDAQQIARQQQLVQQLQATPPAPGNAALQTQSIALSEAKDALQKAQQAQDSDSKALTQAKSQMQQLNQQIQQSRTCLIDAQKNPQSAGQLVGKCGG